MSSTSTGMRFSRHCRIGLRMPDIAVTRSRRSQHSGQAVQHVDRDIAQGTTRRPVVPGRIDRSQRSLTAAGRFVVVPAAGAAPCPVDVAERAGRYELLHGLHGRGQHLTRGGDQRQIALAGGLDHLARFGVGGGHRLLHVDVLAGAQRIHRQRIVVFDRSDDEDEIDIVAGDQLLGVRVGIGNAEALGRLAGARLVDVADRHQLEPLFGVWLGELRQDADQRQAAAPDQPCLDCALSFVPFRCRCRLSLSSYQLTASTLTATGSPPSRHPFNPVVAMPRRK